MASVSGCFSCGLIVRSTRTGHDPDQLPRWNAPPQPAADRTPSGSLNGPQIENEGASILARKAKHRHVGMADGQPFAQPVHESIEIEPAIERAKSRGAGMGTLTPLPDRMTFRAHSFRKRPTAPLQIARRELLGGTGRCPEQRKRDCEPYDHLRAFLPSPARRPSSRTWSPRAFSAEVRSSSLSRI